MFSTIVGVLRAWHVSLLQFAIAGLLLGVPFAGNPGSQCFAKGGGHHSSGHKGHKARNKRHGSKRHHARHHSAKTHRHAKHREHHAHTTHHSSTTDISHSRDVVHTGEVTHHHNGWDYYWGHQGYLTPDIVEPSVVAPAIVGPSIVAPSVVGKRLFFVKLYAPGDRRNHIEEVSASTHENVKAKLLEKYADANFKSIDEKPAADLEDVYVVKFDTPGDRKSHVEDILAATGDKAKERVLEKNADAVFKSVEVKSVINAR